MRVLISTLVLGVIAAALSGCLMVFGLIEYPFFRDNLLYSSIAGFGQAILSIFFLIVLFVILLYSTPPKLHDEQERKLAVFRNRYSPKLRVVCGTGRPYEQGETVGSQLVFSEGKFTMPNSTESQLVRIKVENISEETIHNVRVRLETSDPKAFPDVLPVHLHRMHDNPKDQPYEKTTTLSPRQYAYFDVAQLILLLLNTETHQLAIQITHAETYSIVFLPAQKVALNVAVYGDGVRPCKSRLFLSIDSRGRLRLRSAERKRRSMNMTNENRLRRGEGERAKG